MGWGSKPFIGGCGRTSEVKRVLKSPLSAKRLEPSGSSQHDGESLQHA